MTTNTLAPGALIEVTYCGNTWGLFDPKQTAKVSRVTPTGQVVCEVVSEGQRGAKIRFDSEGYERKPYGKWATSFILEA